MFGRWPLATDSTGSANDYCVICSISLPVSFRSTHLCSYKGFSLSADDILLELGGALFLTSLDVQFVDRVSHFNREIEPKTWLIFAAVTLLFFFGWCVCCNVAIAKI